MKKKIVFLLMTSFTIFGCSEQVIEKYNEKPTLDFISSYGELYSNYDRSYDFSNIFDNTITDSIWFRIQGKVSDKDIHVKFKLETISDSAGVVIDFLTTDPVIKAGEYLGVLKYNVIRPIQGGVVSDFKLKFDYEASDAGRGVVERQEYTMSAGDSFVFSWDNFGITLSDWETYIQPEIGAPDPMKIRFMLSIIDDYNYSGGLPDYLYDFEAGYGMWAQMFLVESLEAYNEANPDKPLTEADGTLVTFEP